MINANDLKAWCAAQELIYASQARGSYSIRLTVSRFGDYPNYEVARRHISSLKRRQLYYGTSIDAAVRIYNEAISQKK